VLKITYFGAYERRLTGNNIQCCLNKLQFVGITVIEHIKAFKVFHGSSNRCKKS